MTLTIELPPEAERRLCRNAAAADKSVQEYLVDLANDLPDPETLSEYEATVALFEQWAHEDAALTPEEAAREDLECQEIEKNILENRLNLPVPEV
jgi:hypothetical protein